MRKESAPQGGSEKLNPAPRPEEMSEMLDAVDALAGRYVSAGMHSDLKQAKRAATQMLHEIRGAHRGMSVAEALNVANDRLASEGGSSVAGDDETDERVFLPPTNPDVAALPSDLDDAIVGQETYPDVFVEQGAPKPPKPVPYPAGLRDHERPTDYVENEESRATWNAARKEFYDAYVANGGSTEGLVSPIADSVSADRKLRAAVIRDRRYAKRNADAVRRFLQEGSPGADVLGSEIPVVSGDAATLNVPRVSVGETVTLAGNHRQKGKKNPHTSVASGRGGNVGFLSTDPDSVNPAERDTSFGLVDADSNIKFQRPLRSKTFDANESADISARETRKERTRATRAALEAGATQSDERVDTHAVAGSYGEAAVGIPDADEPALPPPPPVSRSRQTTPPPLPPLPSPAPVGSPERRPFPYSYVDDNRADDVDPPVAPIIPRPLERPNVTGDVLADRVRHAEGTGIPPGSPMPSADSAEGRPDLYDLNPHLVRPDAAGIPPNTPPSAEARAYAAGLLNRPTIKGRILSGLAWPFKKIGKGIAEVGNWAGFHFDRAYDNVAMNLQNGRTDRAAAKFEAEKAGFEVAKAKTLNIQEAIAAIDKEKAENKEFITPRIAKRMERARRDLEMKLIEAQEAQDQSLRRIKLHEGRTIAHENKRTEIARHYAALVDNRMKPKREAQQALQERKAQYEEEIKAWGEKVAAHQEKIAAIEARAKKNPYCKSAFKGQLKAARKMLADSQREVEKRRSKITGAFGIDSGMFRENLVGVNDTLQKWENKKATYSRIADRKIAQYDQGAYIGSTPAENIAYRNPVENVAAPAGTYSEEGARAREAALESAPNAYGFDDWVNQWNSLNGSKLRLDPDTMFDSAVLREYRAEGHVPFDANEFAGIVKVFLRKKEVAASSKLKAKDVTKLTGQVLESLRQKAADAALARETTA